VTQATGTRQAAPPAELRRTIITLVLLIGAMGAFWYHARLYWELTEDDAYISFQYARNLVRGEGLVFNPGERVEGYSNFAWVMLAAAGLRSGLDPLLLAKTLGLMSGVVALVLSCLLARRLVQGIGFTALLAPYYLAVSPVMVQHSITGLETTFFAALLIATLYLAAGVGRAPALRSTLLVACALLLCLTRPEGPVLAFLILGARGIWSERPAFLEWRAATRDRAAQPHRPGARRTRTELAVLAVLFSVYYAWRWQYFGAPVANTYYAKVQGGLHGVVDGTQYTLDFMRDAGGVWFVALALVPLLLGRTRPLYWTALGTLVMYIGFVVVAAGDWMHNYRFFAHVLPIVAGLIAVGFDALLSLVHPGTARAALHYVVLALLVFTTFVGIGNTELRSARIVLPAVQAHNYLSQNYEEHGVWFAESTPPGTTIAISDVGAIGYFSERRILDMFGLIDPHIARMRGRMHYKADPRYILSRNPDYIVLVSLGDGGSGYSFQRIPDYAMNALPEFHQRYELVRRVPHHWNNEFALIYRRRG
jgi:hypothetical protein